MSGVQMALNGKCEGATLWTHKWKAHGWMCNKPGLQFSTKGCTAVAQGGVLRAVHKVCARPYPSCIVVPSAGNNEPCEFPACLALISSALLGRSKPSTTWHLAPVSLHPLMSVAMQPTVNTNSHTHHLQTQFVGTLENTTSANTVRQSPHLAYDTPQFHNSRNFSAQRPYRSASPRRPSQQSWLYGILVTRSASTPSTWARIAIPTSRSNLPTMGPQ